MRDFDAVIFPGGFGAAKNLSDFAFKGKDCKVNLEVEKTVKDAFRYGKPIGALCISPAIIAKVFEGAKVTIGKDERTANVINLMGGQHITTNHGEVIIDEKYKTATTPCYMLDANIVQIADGAKNIVTSLLSII